jgi:uncharacterized membrane-anchored protein
MQDRHVPFLGPHYWFVLCVASVAGANMGDFVAEYLRIGHVRGLPVLAIGLLAILWAEPRDRRAHTAWYWLAIVTIRTAATNMADFLTVDLHLGQLWTIAGLAVLLFAIFPMARSEVRLYMAAVLIARSGEKGRPTTDFSYWATMIVASTLGTVLGDWSTFGLGLGALKSSIVLSAILAVMFLVHLQPPIPRLLLYWITVVAVRAAGTAVGDFLAKDPRLHLGLAASTALSCTVLALVVWLWRTEASERDRS